MKLLSSTSSSGSKASLLRAPSKASPRPSFQSTQSSKTRRSKTSGMQQVCYTAHHNLPSHLTAKCYFKPFLCHEKKQTTHLFILFYGICTVNPDGERFKNGQIPWTQCVNAEECIARAADETDPVKFVVTFEVVGKYLLKTKNRCGMICLPLFLLAIYICRKHSN